MKKKYYCSTSIVKLSTYRAFTSFSVAQDKDFSYLFRFLFLNNNCADI